MCGMYVCMYTCIQYLCNLCMRGMYEYVACVFAMYVCMCMYTPVYARPICMYERYV